MTTETPRKKFRFLRFVGSFALLLILCGGILYSQRHSLAKHFILKTLHDKGFVTAQLEQLSVNFTGLEAHGLILSKELSIANIQARYVLSPDLSAPIAIQNIEMDNLSWSEPPVTDKEAEGKAPLDVSAVLRDAFALNLPIDHISIKNALITLQPRGPAPQKLKASDITARFNENRTQISLRGALSSETTEHHIITGIESELYNDGHATAALTLDKADANTKMLGAKRVNGWAQIALSQNNKITLHSAEAAIGAGHLYGVPLRSVTLTYHEGDDSDRTLLLRGQSPGKIAEFSLDASLRPHEQDTTALTATLDIKANDIEKLHSLGAEHLTDFAGFSAFEDLKDLKGSAIMRLDFSGKKPTAKLTQNIFAWPDFDGHFSATLKDLTLPAYMQKTNANIKTKIQPHEKGFVIRTETCAITGKDTRNTDFSFNLLPATKDTEPEIRLDTDSKKLSLNTSRFKISYGKIAQYDGQMTAQMSWAPHMIFKAEKINGLLSLPDYQTQLDIKEGTLHSDTASDDLVTADFSAVVDYKGFPIIPLYTDATARYTKAKHIVFEAKARDEHSHGKAILKGDIALKDYKGFVKAHIPRIQFDPTGAQLHHFVPSLKKTLKDSTGYLGLRARITLPEQTVRGGILIKDFSTVFNGYKFETINAVVSVDKFYPLKINTQKIALLKFDPGIPFYDGLATFSYGMDKDKPVHIHEATWKIADGTMSFHDLSFALDNMAGSFDIDIQNMSLQQLLALAPLDGLTATGNVSGKLPITLTPDDLLIKNGEIVTNAPGIVQYAPKELPAFLQDTGNQNMVFLRKALANFRYDKLSFVVNGRTGADQEIKLKAEGRNPDINKTRPIVLNLNLQGALENILQHHVQAYKLPDNIHEQIKKYEDYNDTLP